MPKHINVRSMVNAMESQKNMATLCGGTVSSENLRVALELKELNKDLSLANKIDSLIEIWRNQLKYHNSQPVKVIEYDLETGNPK